MAAEKKETATFDEASKEIQKNIDELMKRVDAVPTKADLSNLEKIRSEKLSKMVADIDGRLAKLEKKVSELDRFVKKIVEIQRSFVSLQQKRRAKSGKLQPKKDELIRERDKLFRVMENVEEEYKGGLISKTSYEEIKRKNEKRLGEIQKLLGE